MEMYYLLFLGVRLPDRAKAFIEFIKALEEDLDAMAEAHTIEDYKVVIKDQKVVLIDFDEEEEDGA